MIDGDSARARVHHAWPAAPRSAIRTDGGSLFASCDVQCNARRRKHAKVSEVVRRPIWHRGLIQAESRVGHHLIDVYRLQTAIVDTMPSCPQSVCQDFVMNK